MFIFDDTMKVGDIIRRISRGSGMTFGAYFQVMRINAQGRVYVRYLEGDRIFFLCNKKDEKSYKVFKTRSVLIRTELFNHIFEEESFVLKKDVLRVPINKLGFNISEACLSKDRPDLLIFWCRGSKERNIVSYEYVLKVQKNKKLYIKYILTNIVGKYIK